MKTTQEILQETREVNKIYTQSKWENFMQKKWISPAEMREILENAKMELKLNNRSRRNAVDSFIDIVEKEISK